jgi:hypothetical protein
MRRLAAAPASTTVAPPPPPPLPASKDAPELWNPKLSAARLDCASQKGTRTGQDSPPNAAIPFIDHSSEMWNFRCDRAYPLSSFQVRKVKP